MFEGSSNSLLQTTKPEEGRKAGWTEVKNMQEERKASRQEGRKAGRKQGKEVRLFGSLGK